ncbi:hypothetical protein [Thermococcus sp.]
MKTDLGGNLLWKRTLGAWEDAIFGGLIEGEEDFILIGSVKDAGWSVVAFELDEEGNTIGEKTLGEGIALDVTDLNGKILITGDKNGGVLGFSNWRVGNNTWRGRWNGNSNSQ